jgi:hypothetical protein
MVQSVLIVITLVLLMVILYSSREKDSYASIETKEINSASIDSQYFIPITGRNMEIFKFSSPSEWMAKKLSYVYPGPPQPDYYPDRMQ